MGSSIAAPPKSSIRMSPARLNVISGRFKKSRSLFFS